MQQSPYAQAVPAILAKMQEGREEGQQPGLEGQPEPLPEVDVYIEQLDGEERITYIRKTPRSEGEEPQPTRQVSSFLLYVGYLALFCFSLFIPSSAVTATIPTVTVSIVPQTQTVSLTGTLQLGRVLSPITLSQEQTVSTTGHGHQDARAAVGILTFFNGSFSPQVIYAHTVYTGSDGVQVATNETVTIPASNPPYVGEATAPASAIHAGERGNIPDGDISITTNTLQVRNSQFHGGLDERYFQTVIQHDIDATAAPLKTTLSQSVQGALEGQLSSDESLQLLPCSPSTTANHHAGEEATQVTVSISFTCSGIAYSPQALTSKVTRLLTAQAVKQLGKGYNLLGDIKLKVIRATPQKNTAVIYFSSQGTWGYELTTQVQERIQALIAGKSKREAMHLLLTHPGIQHASIEGVKDTEQLPADPGNIQLIVS